MEIGDVLFGIFLEVFFTGTLIDGLMLDFNKGPFYLQVYLKHLVGVYFCHFV